MGWKSENQVDKGPGALGGSRGSNSPLQTQQSKPGRRPHCPERLACRSQQDLGTQQECF